jgi:hypothetical protein
LDWYGRVGIQVRLLIRDAVSCPRKLRHCCRGGAHWISLQKADDPAKQLPSGYRASVVDWMEEIQDFADTAALIGGLDLVVSVDTSVAHLAAAMGQPVWLLNRFAGCWRWLRDRDDSPWYRGLLLFTQRELGNWDEVLTRVRGELERRYQVGAATLDALNR